MNPWQLLEKKLSEAPGRDPKDRHAQQFNVKDFEKGSDPNKKNAQKFDMKDMQKKDDKKPVQPLHLNPHKGSDIEGLEDVISQYVPELIKTGRNAESIRNVLLHFSDEVESLVKGN